MHFVFVVILIGYSSVIRNHFLLSVDTRDSHIEITSYYTKWIDYQLFVRPLVSLFICT